MKYLKKYRLRKKKDFNNLFLEKKRICGTFLIIDYFFTKKNNSRLGICVSVKFGKACIRNRFKRQIRQIFIKNYCFLNQATDILIRPAFLAKKATFFQLQKEYLYLLKKILKDNICEENLSQMG